VQRKTLASFAFAAACLGPAASAGAAETDQVAQSILINRSGKSIRACLGEPARRVPSGYDSIWVYPIGTLAGDGPTWFFTLDRNGWASAGACDVRLVVTRYGVLQVFYTTPGGGSLPLGQLCQFAVERCAAP
jgi:hypothetical protein